MNTGRPTPAEVIREDVRASSAYHVQSADGLIKLDAMENPYGLPDALRRELAEIVAGAPLNRYPDPTCPALRAQLRRTMQVPDGCEILLGNGSDEIIQMIIQAVATAGSVVMAPAPTFVMYRVYAGLCRVAYEAVPLGDGFALDTAGFLRAIEEHRPAAIFLAYPNNPTGNLFDASAIEAIARAAPGLVVIDEAYQPFAEASFLPQLDRHPNVLVLRTVSKLGLAGLRLGYLLGAPAWLAEIDKVRSPYNVGVLTQLVAERILAHPEVLDEQARLIRRDRAVLHEGLARLPGVRPYPSRANFILAQVPDAAAVFERLKARGVLVKCLHGSHPSLDQSLRFTVGTAEENRILVDTLATVLG